MTESNTEQRRSLKHRAAVKLLGQDGARGLHFRQADIKAWRDRTLTATGRENGRYLRGFAGRHIGDRCVIIGNGPSLRNTDLGLLRNEITFGLNRIYLMFDELGFTTNFHVVVNELVVQQCVDDFLRIESPLFTTLANRKYLGDAADVGYLHSLPGPRFSTNPSHGVWLGATVTYVAMQLAYYMGFSKVVLVGVDHRFAVQGPANTVVESTGPDRSHFDPNYFGAGFKWQLPDLETSEIAYGLARDAFERSGRRIVDATVDGALTVFPKSDLKTALHR